MIKVAIADDHPTFIRGIQNLLCENDEINLVGTYANGREILEYIGKDCPDVILLDIQMPGKTGDELVPILRQKHPALKVAILSNSDNAFLVENLFRAGIDGYLLKTSRGDVIIEAIHQIFKGNKYIHPDLAQKLEELSLYNTGLANANRDLTKRELQVVQLIAEGFTTQEIAGKLFLSFRTVENYRQTILHKMDAKNVAAMIKKAVFMGLIK